MSGKEVKGGGQSGRRGKLRERLMEPGSVFAEWIEQTFQNYIDFRVWWRHRCLLLEDPRAAMGGDARIRKTPIQFAVQGAIFLAVLTGLASFGMRMLSAAKSESAVRAGEVRSLDKRWKEFEQREREAGVAGGVTLSPSDTGELAELEQETRDFLGDYVDELDRRGANLDLAQQYSASLSILASAALFRWKLRRFRSAFPRVTLADRASLYYLGAALFLPETLVSLSATCVTNVGDIAEGGRLLVAGIVGLVALVVGLPAGAVWYVLALRRCAWTLSHLFGLPADRTAEGGFNGPRVVFRSLIWATIASLIVVAILLSLAERILLAVS